MAESEAQSADSGKLTGGGLLTQWKRALSGKRDSTPARLNLALQGGGAHGAFTWGVLDALLADPHIEFEGLSGSSAGAMNAVVMAHGWLQGGSEGASAAVAKF